MKCPTCTDTALVMSERQGVEIDYCPKCRGVWLDRGELDKLIERSTQVAPAPQPRPDERPQPRYQDSDRGRGHYEDRKKSWLSEIFD